MLSVVQVKLTISHEESSKEVQTTSTRADHILRAAIKRRRTSSRWIYQGILSGSILTSWLAEKTESAARIHLNRHH